MCFRNALESHTATDTTAGLKQAFTDTLVPDLTDNQFADMLAQTIAYGLFAARVQHTGPTPFTRQSAASSVPKTNPFLRGLFVHVTSGSLDDEPYAGMVDDLAQLLNDTDITRVLRNFGSDRRDPIVHFYETFLSAYNPDLRDIRGVYYTPLPVVEFIVGSVDYLLKRVFNLQDGVADTSRTEEGEHRVLMLDPATGTGTFLYATVANIRQRFIDNRRTALWSSYVGQHLLPRLFGFELMVAPYAIAHLKLALQLAGKDLPPHERAGLAYDFASDERVGVFLTNALDPGEAHTTLPLGKFISDEANAASVVKTDKPIMVVFGNPPYQGQSANSSTRREFYRKVRGKDQYRTVKTAIGELLDDYYRVNDKPLSEANSKWLQDDYVKFIRLGQARIEQTGHGILAFVTNHTYLDAPTFRGMRNSLLSTFDDTYVLDLHGSTRRREKNPAGGGDENVFDQIQQGVCITVFVKTGAAAARSKVHYTDLWGTRKTKYTWLESHSIGDPEWTTFEPSAPFYPLRPEDPITREEWDQAMPLTSIFPVFSTGIVTHRDQFAIDTRRDRLVARLKDFCDVRLTDAQVRTKYFGTIPRTTATGITYLAGDNRDWVMSEKRAALMMDQSRNRSIKPVTHRPFDNRYVIYHRDAIDGLKYDVMRHMIAGGNLGLISARSNKSPVQDQFFVTDLMSEVKAGESTTGSVLFPLWLQPGERLEGETNEPTLPGLDPTQDSTVRPNLGQSLIDLLQSRMGLKLATSAEGDRTTSVGPRDVLDYIYAVTYSRTYRVRYEQFLRSDYPRIPFVSDPAMFWRLRDLGHQLVDLHTLRAAALDSGPAVAPTNGTNRIDKITVSKRWVESDDHGGGYLVLNLDGGADGGIQILPNVTREVWGFHIGGHPVLHKWLDARNSETLTYDEAIHLVRMVNAIQRTIEVQDEIEEWLSDWPLS